MSAAGAADRYDKARRVAALVIGDAASFVCFAAIGRAEHGLSLSGFVPVLLTAAPFLAAWFAVAPFAGAFRPRILERIGRTMGRTALAWLFAGPAALLLRAAVLERDIVLSFALVSMTVNLLFLTGWRGTYAWLLGYERAALPPPPRRGENRQGE